MQHLPKPIYTTELTGLPLLAWQLEDRQLLFHTATGESIEFDNQHSFVTAKNAFIAQGHFNVAEMDFKDYRPYQMTFDIFPSSGCNLACSYCLNSQGSLDGDVKLMSLATAEKTVNTIKQFVQQEQIKQLKITLQGGEPLLNPSVVSHFINAFADYKQLVKLQIKTNGSIWHDELFLALANLQEKALVYISLDGDRELNRKRIFSSGKESFDKVMTTIQRLETLAIPYQITSVITDPYPFIDTAQQLASLGIDKVTIKAVKRSVYGREDSNQQFSFDLQQFSTAYRDYNEFALQHPDLPIRLLDREAKLRYLSMIYQQSEPAQLACGAGSFLLGVYADGSIYPCVSFASVASSKLGDVESGISPQLLAEFRDLLANQGAMSVHEPTCQGCIARRLCRGGCYASNMEKSDLINALDENRCAEHRVRYRWDLAYWLAKVAQ